MMRLISGEKCQMSMRLISRENDNLWMCLLSSGKKKLVNVSGKRRLCIYNVSGKMNCISNVSGKKGLHF